MPASPEANSPLRATPRATGAARALGVALPLLALLLGACASEPTAPDLRRLYRQSANVVARQPPLILIPGIMGSKLRDRTSGEQVWPGSFWKLAFASYDELALDIDPVTLDGRPGKLDAVEITDTAAGRDFYDRIVRTLVDYGGYQRVVPGTPLRDPYERRLYLFPYDWRLDNVESARRLAALIDQLRVDYGQPDLKVDIVAHSMGGIVSRYLLQFGTEDVLDRDDPPVTMAGAERIGRVILLGTPSLGSTNAIRYVIAGNKLGMGTIRQETLVTLPSVFQLMPNSERKPLLGIDGRPLRVSLADGTSAERDVFDPETWRALQWSVYDPEVIARVGAERAALLQRYFARHLVRAGRLQRALARPQPASSVKLIVFGADCMLTPSRVLVEEIDGRQVPRFSVDEIRHPQPDRRYELLLDAPGDGTVDKASLLGRQSFDPTVSGGQGFPIAYSFLLCVEHSKLPGNISFQDNLLNALLSR